MQVIPVLEAPEVPNPHGVSVRKLHDSAVAQVMLITLQPGERLKLHSTPVDVLFYAAEGTGTVEIGGEARRVAAGTLVESPARIPHRLMNDEATLFRCMVIKTPRPAEATRLL